MFNGFKNVHFIGIGGAGMSAIAYVLLNRGYRVSGSDLNNGHMINKMMSSGAIIYNKHAESNLDGVDLVVISTAIHADNIELKEAKRRGLPILHRSDILAKLLNSAEGVAVAGAHGKTTTSAMLGAIALQSNILPTVVIGGEIKELDGNACNGNGKYVIAEADESDGSFLKFNPKIAVVTNIENDHLDHYGNEENIYEAFKSFLNGLKFDGIAVLCLDNKKLQAIIKEVDKNIISYGIINQNADYIAKNIIFNSNGTSYDLYYKNTYLENVQLIVPGTHNVLNSLGAIAAARAMGIELSDILKALKLFSGAKRRFETKGKVNKILVVDDYAHHPTEIKATLNAAMQTNPKRLIAIFQPHRFTRTQLLFNDFIEAFQECKNLFFTEIYSAGEDPIDGITGETLAEAVKNKNYGSKVAYSSTKNDELLKILLNHVKEGDLVLTIGAGDIYKVGEKLVEELEKRHHNG